jgi:hypothetical protein|tara:strand:- start:1724 stop:1978 length:255 start_codon:yes stop_codon:yes gene_type:complete
VNDDLLDYLLDGKPCEITLFQMATIETRIHRSALPLDEQQEILNKLPTYTELEAEEVILYILENQVPSDPKDQYKQMVRNGMFK